MKGKAVKLNDLICEMEIMEVKSKLSLLLQDEQQMFLLYFQKYIRRAILEKFPDITNANHCTRRILLKEFECLG